MIVLNSEQLFCVDDFISITSQLFHLLDKDLGDGPNQEFIHYCETAVTFCESSCSIF